jgi:hypothetical protein
MYSMKKSLSKTYAMNPTRSRAWCLICITLLTSIAPYVTHADIPHDMSAVPAVIDEKGKARDIINESITLTNTSNHLLEVYPSVNDVNVQVGKQDFSYAQTSNGLSDSLSNWIELSRGVVSIAPGEQKALPFVVRINENAIAGSYHVVISFGTGDTRTEAEAKVPIATVAVNVEVQADIKEVMQLNKFTSDNIVFTGDDVLFNYQLQNIGNQELNPTGQIVVYDRNGQEVASVDVNKEGKSIAPNQTSQLASVWSAVSGFGKYKALLTVSYGKSQTATVQDTVFFWVIPWKQIVELMALTLIVITVLGLYFHRWFEDRHLHRLAAAGALKPGAFEHMRHAQAQLVALPELPPLPPVREVAQRVQAQVEQKREAFSVFKRQGFVSVPEPLARALVEHAPANQTSSAKVDGGTIDLSAIRTNVVEQKPSEEHIINLKKIV